jgi:arsenate reductase-like glutaredoxin family protein
VRFREVDGDIDASDEMHARANAAHVTLTGIPMLVVRGRVVVGFNPDAIERALRD